MEQHPAGLSLKTSLPLHEPTAEKEEKGGECQRGVETLSSACSWTNRSQQFAWRHALPALSAAVDSATRYLLNHCQPSKLNSGAATYAILITGAGTHTDGSFLWGGGGVTTYSLMPRLKVKRQLYLRKKCSKGYMQHKLPFVCQFILNGVHHWWDRQFQRLLLLGTSSRLSVLAFNTESKLCVVLCCVFQIVFWSHPIVAHGKLEELQEE